MSNNNIYLKLIYFCSFIIFISNNITIIKAVEFDLIEKVLTECVIPPLECPNENITFWFYQRSARKTPTKIDFCSTRTLHKIKFNYEFPIKIIIHGYAAHRNDIVNIKLRNAYFKKNEMNIISIDYSPLVKSPCYLAAVKNVQLVGKCTAQFIDLLVGHTAVQLSRIHVIGFSLGAHVAGVISNYLQAGDIDRITGLDPAAPLFTTVCKANKLDKGDAKFVDVIHTDALGKGKLETCGDADFYVNGGVLQPGCEKEAKISSCNHMRAPLYYAESIRGKTEFWGKSCFTWFTYKVHYCRVLSPASSYVVMGEDIPDTAEGSFFLTTNSEPPYARGKEGATFD